MAGWGRRAGKKVSQTLAQLVDSLTAAADELVDRLTNQAEEQPVRVPVPVRKRPPHNHGHSNN